MANIHPEVNNFRLFFIHKITRFFRLDMTRMTSVQTRVMQIPHVSSQLEAKIMKYVGMSGISSLLCDVTQKQRS